MAVRISIDQTTGIETGRFSDIFDLPAVLDFWTALASHPGHDPRHHQLLDLRQVTMSAFNADDVQAVADQTRTRTRHAPHFDNRSAALIADDAGYSDIQILRLFIAYLAHKRPDLESRMRIFRDEAAARRWLASGTPS